jgi:hypothetical protein
MQFAARAEAEVAAVRDDPLARLALRYRTYGGPWTSRNGAASSSATEHWMAFVRRPTGAAWYHRTRSLSPPCWRRVTVRPSRSCASSYRFEIGVGCHARSTQRRRCRATKSSSRASKAVPGWQDGDHMVGDKRRRDQITVTRSRRRKIDGAGTKPFNDFRIGSLEDAHLTPVPT